MTRYGHSIGKWAIALILLTFAHPAAAQDSAGLAGQALVNALREGGYNIYFRHAATDWSLNDHVTAAGDWTSCDPARMRQLAPEGRRAARSIGEAIRALRIPVGDILASPYCRTVETARLMALGPVKSTTDVMNMRVAAFFGGVPVIAKRARERLSIPPKTATNTILVAHGNVLRAATDLHSGEGEAVVFRPDGNGGFSLIARVAPQEWVRLAAEWAEER